MVVASDVLARQLQTFKGLPKQYTVKVKAAKPGFKGHTSHYALVKVSDSERSVIVPYEVLRKFMERLHGQRVMVTIQKDGIYLSYRTGQLFLKHLDGEWKDVAEVNLGA